MFKKFLELLTIVVLALIDNKAFSLVNQYPTIMKALKQNIPPFVQGKSLLVFEYGK